MLDVRILGPLEAHQAGRELPLGGRRQRALLALLALRANRVTQTADLVELIWGADAPETAFNTLQVYVGKLRRTLEPDVGARGNYTTLVTRDPGYVLVLPEEQLDAQRFEVLAEAGRMAARSGRYDEAHQLLNEALSLWRGPLLVDLDGESFVTAPALRLDGLRIAALEDKIETDVALGRHVSAIAECEALISEHPYRERLYEHLMLALYRSGRQADALQVFQRSREALVDGLGIDPGPQLRLLERAILEQDASLDLPPPVKDRQRSASPDGTTTADTHHDTAARHDREAPHDVASPDEAASPDDIVADVDTSSVVPQTGAKAAAATYRAPITVVHVAATGLQPSLPTDPEAAPSDQLTSVAGVLAGHGAEIVTLSAEHVTAAFGMDAARSDDARRGLLAALAVSSPMFAVGVASGVVLVPDDDRLGHAGRRASRLADEHAEGVIADMLTVQRCRTPLRWTQRSSDSVLVEAVAPRQFRSRRLRGRASELALIDAVVDQAVQRGTPHVVTITGPPGIGRSRLLDELRDRWPTLDDPVVIEGHERMADAVEVLTGAINLISGNNSAAPATIPEARGMLEAALASRATALLLLIDDADHMPPTALDVIMQSLAATPERAIVGIIAADEVALASSSLTVLGLTLGGVDAAAADELVRELAPHLDDMARAEIVDRCGGNPLIIESAASFEQDSGQGPHHHAVDLAVRAAVDRVPPDSARLLGFLSAASHGADQRLLRAVPTGLPSDTVDALLHQLQSRDLIRRSTVDGRLRPRHRLVGTVAFDRLTRADKLAALQVVTDQTADTEPALAANALRRAAALHLDAGHNDWLALQARAARESLAAAWQAIRAGDPAAATEHVLLATLCSWQATPHGMEPLAVLTLLQSAAPTTTPPAFVERMLHRPSVGGPRRQQAPSPEALLDYASGPRGRLIKAAYLRAIGQHRLAANELNEPGGALDEEWAAMASRLATGDDRDNLHGSGPLAAAAVLFRTAQQHRSDVSAAATDAWLELAALGLPTIAAGCLNVYAALNSAIHGDIERARHLLREGGPVSTSMPELVVANAWIAVREGGAAAPGRAVAALRTAQTTDDRVLRAEAAALVAFSGVDPELDALRADQPADVIERWQRVLASKPT